MRDETEKLFSATKKDFRVETMRGKGPGGQKRNKTDSCVRITHIESGMSEYCCETKSQHQNRAKAFRRLAKRLVAKYCESERRERYAAGNTTIRTYHEPDDRVTDMETGSQFSYRRTVGKGDLAAVIEDRASRKLSVNQP